MSLLRPSSHRWRHNAVLGGSTSWGDVVRAAGYAAVPHRPADRRILTAYERAFADEIGAREAVSFGTGRVALFAILRGLGVGPGDEVLVPVPTHVVVPNAVRRCGAVPVFVDCRYDTFGLDVDHARSLVTPRTRALLVQHTFGIPADLEGALELGRSAGIAVVEDCVHALGARHAGRPVGSLATAGFFSTEETKTLSTTMGGMAVTDDPALAQALRRVQDSCAPPATALVRKYMVKLIGYHLATAPAVHRLSRALYEVLGRPQPLPRATSAEERHAQQPEDYLQRLSAAQATLGLRQLRRLDAQLAHRRTVADVYARGLRELGVRFPEPLAGDEPGWLRYPVWVDDAAQAHDRLTEDMVPGTWFTAVLEEAADAALAGYASGSCPRAEALVGHLLNLATHPRVSRRDAEAAVSALTGFLPARSEPAAAAGAAPGAAPGVAEAVRKATAVRP